MLYHILALCLFLSVNGDLTPLILNTLNDTVSTQLGAHCLDGTPVVYYHRPGVGENATKFIIYFQGGGWCYGFNDCVGRSKNSLGSSSADGPTIIDMGGIVSDDPEANPDYHTWNHVYARYCDGNSWSGNQAEPVTVGSDTLYFRGHANMEALINHVKTNHGLSQATDVVMDGGSAGGLTVFLHADYLASLLDPATRFVAMGDAGFFRPDVTLDNLGYTAHMTGMYKMINATVNEACMLANTADPSQCIFAPVVFPYITSDFFILEGVYDSWQLQNIMGFSCATYGQPLNQCTAAQNATLEAYGDAMRKAIAGALVSTPHHVASAGAFVSQCIIHVQSDFNEKHCVWHDELFIDGLTPHDAFSLWYNGGKGAEGGAANVHIEDCGLFGCNPYCQSFT